jgi:hypothetical protein
MARVSYVARREGRYYLQVRCGQVVAGLLDCIALRLAPYDKQP